MTSPLGQSAARLIGKLLAEDQIHAPQECSTGSPADYKLQLAPPVSEVTDGILCYDRALHELGAKVTKPNLSADVAEGCATSLFFHQSCQACGWLSIGHIQTCPHDQMEYPVSIHGLAENTPYFEALGIYVIGPFDPNVQCMLLLQYRFISALQIFSMKGIRQRYVQAYPYVFRSSLLYCLHNGQRDHILNKREFVSCV